ncbi:MAG: GNAT family N-acetyltransferase [Chloroflexota bacterium]
MPARNPVAPDVRLRPWGPDDLPLLERLLGDPAMTVHLGGPEPPLKLRRLHQEYLALRPPMGRIFAILAGEADDGDPGLAVGSAGYWLSDRAGEGAWELGCSVLPEFQGRGYGTQALLLAPEFARRDGPGRTIHAYPAVDNGPSNAMCRRAGFRLDREIEIEIRPGHPMCVNDWVLDAV